jgi:FkbM family methyltransferase
VGGAGKVSAFEPIPFTHDVCAALLKKLGTTNVALCQKGVGTREDQVKFSVPLQDFGAMSAGQAHMAERRNELEGKENYYTFDRATEFTCHVVALDDFLALDQRPLSFVKIDIEGAEFYALQGMHRLLEARHPVVLIEIQPFFLEGFGVEESALVKLIDQLG